MARCNDCGFPVTFVTTEEGDQPEAERFPIDERATEMTGERYFFPDPAGKPGIVQKMSPAHVGYGHGDHRLTCPVRVRAARL